QRIRVGLLHTASTYKLESSPAHPKSSIHFAFFLSRVMNGEIQSPQQVRLHQDIAENVTLESPRSKLREATEFESVTLAEPMEEYAPPRPPLRLIFEDHGGATAQEVEEVSSTSTKSTRDSFKKRTSFAERPQVVNLSHEELVRLAKPEVMDYMDQDLERSLSEQCADVLKKETTPKVAEISSRTHHRFSPSSSGSPETYPQMLLELNNDVHNSTKIRIRITCKKRFENLPVVVFLSLMKLPPPPKSGCTSYEAHCPTYADNRSPKHSLTQQIFQAQGFYCRRLGYILFLSVYKNNYGDIGIGVTVPMCFCCTLKALRPKHVCCYFFDHFPRTTKQTNGCRSLDTSSRNADAGSEPRTFRLVGWHPNPEPLGLDATTTTYPERNLAFSCWKLSLTERPLRKNSKANLCVMTEKISGTPNAVSTQMNGRFIVLHIDLNWTHLSWFTDKHILLLFEVRSDALRSALQVNSKPGIVPRASYDPTTSRMLRQYITSYPNGKLLSPVAWLRYSGYMRLFSPENSLGILRATVGIYNLAFYNFPVFEENKLRLFIKFYSGFPLRHMYTTSIHDFSSTNTCNIIIRFTNDTDSSSSNVGLRLQGNISLIAYHCRPYPARRLRLFRLHLHSCQCIVDPLTFQKDDFDDLCDGSPSVDDSFFSSHLHKAFPSTMRMELHTTNRNPSTSVCVDVREERISPNSAFGESTTTGFPGNACTPVKNHLSDPMSPDNAVRLHDSLENLNSHSAGDRRMTRYVSFSRFETLDGLIQLTGQHPLGQVNLHRLSLPPVEEHCGTYDTLAYANTETTGLEESYGQSEMSPRKKGIHKIFSSTRRKTNKEATTTDTVADSDLMPPPTEPLVPRKGHKRKYNVGRRLLKFLASKGGALEVPDTDKLESPEISDLGISEGSSEESSSTSSLLNLFTRLRYRHTEHSTYSSSHKGGPPKKTRKVVTVDEMNRQIVSVGESVE
ncbi:TNS1 protein, partial [Clonorchis sinensis]